MGILDSIDSPEDLRGLSVDKLPEVCEELRALVLETVSKHGGHLSSNLGTVELAVALHYAFDTPRDRIVWDVGHQAYPHKVLTGRRDRFSSIRQQNGLSGFTCRAESEFDHFGAGHASTSISAATGIAEGLKHRGSKNLAVAVIGDGALTGGLAYEAMNNAGHIPVKNLVVVFNDNDMSIDPNVGALSQFVNQTVTHPGYNRFRKEVRGLLEVLSNHGVPLVQIASRLRRGVKQLFTPGVLFECFGFRYLGPVNGHDVNALLETLQFIKNEGETGGPYLVHAITVKGKGYSRAEENSLKYHGVTPFKSEVGIEPPAKKKTNYQDVFAETLIRLAKEDPRIVAITAAMPSGTGLNRFQAEFPNRCYDVGIAEAHAVLFAAGLATEGFLPVAAIYSTFLQRAYDQIIHDVCLQNLPVIFALDRSGLVGADGATHQGAFDLSYLRAVPNMVIMAPKDEAELQHMLKTAVGCGAPVAIRYPRGEVVGVPTSETLRTLPMGKAEFLSSDSDAVDVLFLGIGYGVQIASNVTDLIRKDGVSVSLINARFVKPLDESLIVDWARRSRLVVTLEENSVLGGFGSAVLELLQRRGVAVPVLTLGLPDTFIEHGTPQEQRTSVGLDVPTVARKVLSYLNELPVSAPTNGELHPEISEREPIILQ